ncbi:MAG: aa3-type cytochrome c oxidase subunit IV [Halopseudomonas aestusnigri]
MTNEEITVDRQLGFERFTKVTTYSVVIIAAVLLLMAVTLV